MRSLQHPLPVAQAMAEALYGPDGLYRRLGPRDLFSTSVSASPLLAEAIAELAARVARKLGEDGLSVVDAGSGDGALLAGLAAVVPASWRLVGVDLRSRPPGLPVRVEWQPPPASWWTAAAPQVSGPDLSGLRGLVVAHELLDDVPVGVHRRATAGWRELAEDGTDVGASTGGTAAWLDRWCAAAELGVEAESGERRDALWGALVGSVTAGAALAVDYAVPSGEVGGTLRGYAGGRLVPVRFDGSVQVTAGVRFDALAAAGAAAGAASTLDLTQREALAALGVHAPSRPSGAGSSAAGSSAAGSSAAGSSAAELVRAAELAHLRDPHGLGAHRWLLQGVGLEVGPLVG